MAAGLSLRPGAIPDLRAFLCDRLGQEAAAADLEDALDIDALVAPSAAGRGLLDEFAVLAPFGPGNPEPVFGLNDVRVERPFALRGGHLKCDLVGPGGGRLKAIAWRSADTPLGARLLAAGGAVHVAGRLKPDDWNGRRGVQLEIDDLADPHRAR
jgi:single-stranded-DNA-specific exonuclease